MMNPLCWHFNGTQPSPQMVHKSGFLPYFCLHLENVTQFENYIKYKFEIFSACYQYSVQYSVIFILII